MDQKKVLWVVAGVGIFLVIVLGAALHFYAPAHKPEEPVASATNWVEPPKTEIATPEKFGGIDLNALGNAAATNSVDNAFTTVNGTIIGGAETPPPPPPKADKPAAKKPKPVAKNRSYWVQAASFSDQILAEQARDTLIAARVDSEIFTAEQHGKLFYRVRIGPYKSQSEAEYWMNIAKDIRNAKGLPIFPNSFVTSIATPN